MNVNKASKRWDERVLAIRLNIIEILTWCLRVNSVGIKYLSRGVVEARMESREDSEVWLLGLFLCSLKPEQRRQDLSLRHYPVPQEAREFALFACTAIDTGNYGVLTTTLATLAQSQSGTKTMALSPRQKEQRMAIFSFIMTLKITLLITWLISRNMWHRKTNSPDLRCKTPPKVSQ